MKKYIYPSVVAIIIFLLGVAFLWQSYSTWNSDKRLLEDSQLAVLAISMSVLTTLSAISKIETHKRKKTLKVVLAIFTYALIGAMCTAAYKSINGLFTWWENIVVFISVLTTWVFALIYGVGLFKQSQTKSYKSKNDGVDL
jgi:Ca2+/Na+ antiporter